MQRAELQRYLEELLEVRRLRDYCPNGLQVEGRESVEIIVTGVTACRALLNEAVNVGAHAVVVHHGYFWRGEDPRVTGVLKNRLATLLRHDINLFAFHLPLDMHPEIGNNAQLAKRMRWTVDDRFGDQDVGFLGKPAAESTSGLIAEELSCTLGRRAFLVGDALAPVKRIAWCTGAAQAFFEQAVAAGADLYVSGEISEQTVHLARELNVPYISAGHHATERYGVQALGEHRSERFRLRCIFVDIDNPI